MIQKTLLHSFKKSIRIETMTRAIQGKNATTKAPALIPTKSPMTTPNKTDWIANFRFQILFSLVCLTNPSTRVDPMSVLRVKTEANGTSLKLKKACPQKRGIRSRQTGPNQEYW